MIARNKYEQVFKAEDFYENFQGLHSENELGIGKLKRRKHKLSLSLYKKILLTFHDIHAKELYFMKKESYHILGGDVLKTVTNPAVIYRSKHKYMPPLYKNSSIGLIWYNRPSELFTIKCDFFKQGGGQNRIGVLEKAFRKTYDIDLLPKFDEEINRLKPKIKRK